MQNDHVRLSFGAADGRLLHFETTGTQDDLIKGQQEAPPPFSVVVGNGDGTEQTEAIPGAARVRVENDTASLSFETLRTANAELAIEGVVTVRLPPGSTESRWTLQLTNHEASKVVYVVTLPRIHGVRLGANWEDDALYFPFWGGERFPSAVKVFADMAEQRIGPLERGNNRVQKKDTEYVHDLQYAGGCSMMWMDYTDAASGLYIASYDPSFLVTTLHAGTRGPDAGSMSFEFRKWVTIRPQQVWTSPVFVVAAHGKDWHWAADQYRAWFSSQVPLSFHGGEWRKRVGGWLTSLKGTTGPALRKFSDLPGQYSTLEKAGMDTIFPFGWSEGGFDGPCPVYYPDLEVGGPMEMFRAYKAIRERGGHVMAYTNGRIFNLRSPYFEALGKPWALTNADGTMVTEPYGPEKFAVMCPGAEGWRNLMADFGESLARHYATDLVYFDQVAAAPPAPCFSTMHGHEQTGLWNQQYRTFLKQASEQCTAAAPDAALMIEGCGDLYVPYAVFQSYLGANYAGTRFAFPELYKYTFPEAIQSSLIMFPTPPQEMYGVRMEGISRDTAAYWLCHEIMLGNYFAFLDPLLKDEAWWNEVQQFVALRKSAAPWMASGVFRDTADVISAPDGVEVKTFRCDSSTPKSVLVAVHEAARRESGTVSVWWGAEGFSGAYRLLPGERRTPVSASRDGEKVSFELPKDELVLVVLEQ